MSDTTIDLFTALQTALGPQYRIERELGRGGMGVVFLGVWWGGSGCFAVRHTSGWAD